MDEHTLQPWMLWSDWRDDARPWLRIDLDAWPAETPIDPRPPMLLVGVGDRDHPQARHLDLVLEPGFSIDQVTKQLEAAPQAAMTIAQLLRATEGLSLETALTLESFAFAMLQGGQEHSHWLGRWVGVASDAQAPPGEVHVTRTGDRLDVTLDRPDGLNEIDRGMRDALYDAFALAALDPDIATVRLLGEGRTFSMGADLTEFGTTRDPARAHAIRTRTLPAWQLIRRPDIYEAHIQGGCVGSGLELAAFCPRVTATRGAWFQLPEAGMGILSGFGGCVSIPRRVGRQRAALLMLSGKRINAEKALAWGLVDALVDDAPADQRRADQVDG